MAIEMVQVTKLSEQRKWLKRFAKGYDGEVQLTKHTFDPKLVKFFVAKEGNNELGFIRISDKSRNFNPTDEVWCAQDAYVKPVYRGKGVLRYMLKYVMDVENVGMAHIAPKVLLQNYPYYTALGFTSVNRSRTGLLFILTDKAARLLKTNQTQSEAA
jgi:predicted N-acetyltransferase YhbS